MSNEVRLLLGAATDVGKVREVNEDAHGFVRCRLGDLVVVCDGMGGHAAGDLASQTALDAILAHAISSRATDERVLLREAIVAAHTEVRRIADASPERAGMGTTVVAALVRAGWAWVANVGDSRCYLVRDGNAAQLSKDHTKGQRLLDGGLITAEQLETHPDKGVLVQALGQREVPEPFVSDAQQLRLGDTLVLCSDGVYESMHTTMADVAKVKNPNYAAHDLAAKAVERDGKDNATVIVARFADLHAPAEPVRPVPVPPADRPGASPPGKKPWLWMALIAGTGLLSFAAGRMTAASPSAQSHVVASPVAVPKTDDKRGDEPPAAVGTESDEPPTAKIADSPEPKDVKPSGEMVKPAVAPSVRKEVRQNRPRRGRARRDRETSRRPQRPQRRRSTKKASKPDTKSAKPAPKKPAAPAAKQVKEPTTKPKEGSGSDSPIPPPPAEPNK